MYVDWGYFFWANDYCCHVFVVIHNNDAIMSAMASQITSLTIVYSTVDSDADQRKHRSSALLAFVRGIHRGPVNSPHKWPVTRKMFPFDDVIIPQTPIYLSRYFGAGSCCNSYCIPFFSWHERYSQIYVVRKTTMPFLHCSVKLLAQHGKHYGSSPILSNFIIYIPYSDVVGTIQMYEFSFSSRTVFVSDVKLAVS